MAQMKMEDEEFDDLPCKGWGARMVWHNHSKTFRASDELTESNERELEWREQHGSMVEQNRYMLQTGLNSDCRFTVGPTDGDTEVFPAHKFVVCRSSSVIETMFHTHMAEAESGEVRITDIEPAIFKLLLVYMYCDELGVTCGEEALALSYAAHKYQLSHLLRKCVEYLCSRLEPRLLWQTRELADLISQQELRDKCMEMIAFKTDESLSAEGFEEVDVAVLCEVLREDCLNVTSEMTLVEGALRWALHRIQQEELQREPMGGRIREVLGPAFSLLRFLTLTPEEFASGPALENWLTSGEKTCIYTNIITPGRGSINPPLCSNTNKRIIPPTLEVFRNCPENFQILNRPIFNEKTIFNGGNMNCILSFIVDKEIWLRGITVAAQSNEALGEVCACDIGCIVTQERVHHICGRGVCRGVLPEVPGRKFLVTHTVDAEEPGLSARRGVVIGRGRGRSETHPTPPVGGPRTLDARPPANFFIAEHSPTKYTENINMSLLKIKYTHERVYTIQNSLNIDFKFNRNYNSLNMLQFPMPILLNKTDDLSWAYGEFYLLKLQFQKAGYYKSGESVDHLRCGEVDFKFNIAVDQLPMLNHGLVRSLQFSPDG